MIDVSGLGFGYGDRPVFEAISFSIRHGESVGIAGANGAGKSTLLWCVLGLLKCRGAVRLFGEKPGRKTLARCGVVFQNPEDQLFMPSILDDVALRGITRGEALSALRRVGLEEKAEEPASRLSLGQRKRAAIAAALAGSPELLVLDEPTAELDGRSVRELAGTLKSLGTTKLIASHDLGLLRCVASRIIVLADGGIAADGDTKRVLSDEGLLREAGLL